MRSIFGDGGPTLESLSKPASVAPMKSMTGWSQGLAYKNLSSRDIRNPIIWARQLRLDVITLDGSRSRSRFASDR
jgi:hypothetical protein